MERVGEALFDGITPEALRARTPTPPIDEPQPSVGEQLTGTGTSAEIPRTLRHVLGSNLDDVPWIQVAPRIEQHILPLSSGAGGDLRVLRLAPGGQIPEHGHRGEELSLVLRGSCHDHIGTYSVGDFMDLDDETRHAVVADAESGCIVIIASEVEPEFASGWVDKSVYTRSAQSSDASKHRSHL
ncbi:MAG: cupin domain-containing protein [Pseudomonadota bacterium]